MAEAFVKTFKRDYIRISPIPNAAAALAAINHWIEDYNTVHPHSRLGYRSPRECSFLNSTRVRFNGVNSKAPRNDYMGSIFIMLAAQTPALDVRRSNHGVRPIHSRRVSYSERSHLGNRVNGIDQRQTISLALIDPKPFTRQAILNMLAAAFAERASLLSASSFRELFETIDSMEGLNFIILYIRSAGVTDNWVQEQLREIKAQLRDIAIIMMSDRDDTDDVVNALNNGIRGYIPTSSAVEVAIAALTLIEAGGIYIPAAALPAEASQIDDASGLQIQLQTPQGLNLTSRELAVINLLREGNANKVIANKLNMRESTVKVHVRSILKKLSVNNRTHAAAVANRLLANSSVKNG